MGLELLSLIHADAPAVLSVKLLFFSNLRITREIAKKKWLMPHLIVTTIYGLAWKSLMSRKCLTSIRYNIISTEIHCTQQKAQIQCFLNVAFVNSLLIAYSCLRFCLLSERQMYEIFASRKSQVWKIYFCIYFPPDLYILSVTD